MPENSIASKLFEIQPSRLARMFLWLLHVLALFGCWLNSTPVEYRLAFSLLLIGLLIIHDRYWNVPKVLLRYTPHNSWEILAGQDNEFVTLTILGTTTITDWAIFLHYKTHTQSSGALLIAKDSLMADSFRCLKVRLKLSESHS